MKTIKIDQHPIYANYIELLKGVLLNEFGYENGLRISYLLYCMDTSQPYDLDDVINIQNYQPEKIQALRDDPDSQHNYRERMFGFPYSMIGKARLDSLQMMVETVLRERIPGDFLEAGVWRGGASIFMRAMLELWGDSKRNVYVADSFKGLPPPKLDQDENLNFHLDPTLSVSLDVVKSHFERFGQLNDRVKFMPGWFEDTLSADEPSQLAILRAELLLVDLLSLMILVLLLPDAKPWRTFVWRIRSTTRLRLLIGQALIGEFEMVAIIYVRGYKLQTNYVC